MTCPIENDARIIPSCSLTQSLSHSEERSSYFLRETSMSAALDPIGAGLRGNSLREPQNPTIEEITRYYLETRRTDVKETTYRSYCAQSLPYIVGPLPTGAKGDRCAFTALAVAPKVSNCCRCLDRFLCLIFRQL